MARFTAKRKRFCAEYIFDLKPAQAAIRAGFAEKYASEQAYQLLQDPQVQAEIERLQLERGERTRITSDRVLEELGVVGFSDVRHYVIDDHGNVTLAAGAPDAAMRAVSSIKRKHRQYSIGRGDNAKIVNEYDTEIHLWSKPDGLQMAGKHLGMFVERVEHTGKDGKDLIPANTDLSGYTTEELLALKEIHERAIARRNQQGTS